MIRIFLNRDNKIISKNRGVSIVTIIVMFAVIILILGMCAIVFFMLKEDMILKVRFLEILI